MFDKVRSSLAAAMKKKLVIGSSCVIVLLVLSPFIYRGISKFIEKKNILEEVENAMVYVEGDLFAMGSSSGGKDEAPVHKVIVSDFYINKYEVTQMLYNYVMQSTITEQRDKASGKELSGEGGEFPVYYVSWFEAVEFCNALSKLAKLTPAYTVNGDEVEVDWNADGYRLPAEAEWEFAAKGGKNNKQYTYSGSDNLDEVAWYRSNSEGESHPVGSKKSNELGVYDMAGNVYEWCWDWYDRAYYASSPERSPKGPLSGLNRVVRGGGFANEAFNLRPSDRNSVGALERYKFLGFRIARNL